MRRIVTMGMLVTLLWSLLPSSAVRAASFAYNDPHGQWSLLLPDAYQRTDDQYHIGEKENEGFSAFASFSGLNEPALAVSYRECCRPDPSKLLQLVQEDFRQVQQASPDTQMTPDGIQPAMLSGQPGLQYDYFSTNKGFRSHARVIAAFSGGLVYMLRFATQDTKFEAMASNIATISNSFRFYGRNIVAGVYNDPQGRFTFSAPPQYGMIPNFLDAQDNRQLSFAAMSPNPNFDENVDPYMFVQTFGDSSDDTFDDLFITYATKGQQSLAQQGAELGAQGVRRITLDSHAAGMSDDYENSDTGVREHVFRVFTLLAHTQYLFNFVLPEHDTSRPISPVDAVLASFHFQAPDTTANTGNATWIDPTGFVQLQYPSGWTVSIEQDNPDSVLELLGPDGTYFYMNLYDPQTDASLAEEAQDDLDGDATDTKFNYVDGPVTDTTVGSEPAKTYSFKYTPKNKFNSQIFNGRRWDVNYEGKELLLTGDANATHQAEIDAVIASITFIK